MHIPGTFTQQCVPLAAQKWAARACTAMRWSAPRRARSAHSRLSACPWSAHAPRPSITPAPRRLDCSRRWGSSMPRVVQHGHLGSGRAERAAAVRRQVHKTQALLRSTARLTVEATCFVERCYAWKSGPPAGSRAWRRAARSGCHSRRLQVEGSSVKCRCVHLAARSSTAQLHSTACAHGLRAQGDVGDRW